MAFSLDAAVTLQSCGGAGGVAVVTIQRQNKRATEDKKDKGRKQKGNAGDMNKWQADQRGCESEGGDEQFEDAGFAQAPCRVERQFERNGTGTLRHVRIFSQNRRMPAAHGRGECRDITCTVRLGRFRMAHI